MLYKHLSIQDLETQCQHEQAKFDAGSPNNPVYCYELLMRLHELPVNTGINISLRVLHPYVARTIRYHPLLVDLGDNPTSLAADIVINFFFKKMMTLEFQEKSTSFAGILTLLNRFSHTQIVHKYRQDKRHWFTDLDDLDHKVDLNSEITDDFREIFIQCIEKVFPNNKAYRELAYLTFIHELKPRDIEAQYPAQWTSIKQTVSRIRRRMRQLDFLECIGVEGSPED